MRRKYLIKKDPAIEAKDNWLVMTYRQYKAWLNTPEGKSRELTLGVLKGCCDGDVEYHIECDEQTAKKWKKDQNHSDYLRQIWFRLQLAAVVRRSAQQNYTRKTLLFPIK